MFGILKNRFAILRCNPDLAPDIQVRLPAALAALHNVIREYDQDDLEDILNNLDFADQGFDKMDLRPRGEGELADGPPRQAEKRDADERRDKIAESMWIQYQAILATREQRE
jgi:hypothetical protein